jgi:dCMP deaminase
VEVSAMKWPEYLMGFARHAALKSKDATQVGAALVGPEGEIRLTGFNGPPRGVHDTPDRRERPRKYLFASHAEANTIAFAAREGIRTKGCTLYVTHHPCAACARSIIQAGIVCVVVGDGKTSMPDEEFEAAAEMFAEAGTQVVRHQPPEPVCAIEEPT